MRYVFVKRFTADLEKLSAEIQRKFFKQLKFLLRDIRYPSLRAKKHDESLGIWQARIDDHFRFYFKIDKDCYVFLRTEPHRD